jgi:hypothetical protein
MVTYVHLRSDDLPESPFAGEGGNAVGTQPTEPPGEPDTAEAAESVSQSRIA